MFMKRFCSQSCQIVSVLCAPNAIKAIPIRKRTIGRNSSSLKKMFFICVMVACILASAKVEAQTTTIRVPADQPTIQSAINVATNGDTVLVAPGTYFENIDFHGKAITVTSEVGPEVTIIDGQRARSVATFDSGEGRASVLNGFTLQNGRSGLGGPGFGDGGGIRIEGASPTIRRNIIKNNVACNGCGISIAFSSPLIQSNTITNNTRTECTGGIGGAGISISGNNSAEILDNVISNNFLSGASGGGISLVAPGFTIIRGNIIKGNSVTGLSPGTEGGGILIDGSSDAVITQNLITGNHADFGAGISSRGFPITRGTLIVNNTIADNDAREGSGVWFFGSGELTNNIIVAKPGQSALIGASFCDGLPPAFKFNNIFSPLGNDNGENCPDKIGIGGNISADPRFVAPSAGDYHLQAGSPSIDSGSNTVSHLTITDFDGDTRILDGDGNGTVIVDMGVDEFLMRPSFDICLQDESNGNMLKINSTTGQYLFTRSGGITLGGTGNLTVRDSLIILQARAADHSVLALIERRLKKAAALIHVPAQGAAFTIVDKNTSDNTCSGT
jgi:Right handed beta helix region